MKRRIVYILVVFVIGVPILFYDAQPMVASTSGAPQGHTNSPANGRTCNSCHGGPSPVFVSNIISSDIPVSGYVPGTTYTISATVNKPGFNKYGFQISPQSNSGTTLGQLKSVNIETALIASGRYITHTSSGTIGSGDSKTWIFEWIAPNEGTGEVTFYGGFLAANSNESSSGDQVQTSSLTVQENKATAINNSINQTAIIGEVFPNPSNGVFSVRLQSMDINNVTFELFDLQGRKVADMETSFSNMNDSEVTVVAPQGLSKGVYTLLARSGSQIAARKISLQ